MNTYSTIDELWYEALLSILSRGHELPSRDGPTKEVLGYVARLSNPRAHFLFNPIRRVNPSYAAAELLWFLSGQRTVHALTPYAPQYVRFCNEACLYVNEAGDELLPVHTYSHTHTPFGSYKPDTLYAHGAYGYRLARQFGGRCQLENIIRMLQADPMSRQAVITLYDAGMDQEKATSGDKKDIPCTLSLNFILRDGKLNCQGTMRSNDIWLGLPHDIWAFTSIQLLVAEALGVEVGWYQHSAMSLHLYDRNRAKAEEAARYDMLGYERGPMTYGRHTVSIFDAFQKAVKLERVNRLAQHGIDLPGPVVGANSLLGHTVVMAAHKWVKDKRITLKYIESPIMARYMEKHWC